MGSGNAVPLETLNDEFVDSNSLHQWQLFSSTEKYLSKVRSLSVKDGILNLQPFASGWYGDYQAPFLYKTISGDFDVRIKLKVSGTNTSLPENEWSLAGLMIRQPKRTTSENWQPRQENWMFLTTGIAEPKGTPVFEVKSTENSLSNLKLRPAKTGWVELRAVRVQASFILMYRYEGEQWTILERFYRPLMPPTLQVGFNAYSGWNEVPAGMKGDVVKFNSNVLTDINTDLLLQVDYMRFRQPQMDKEKLKALAQEGFRAPYYTPANLLCDFSVSNQQVLEIVGKD